MKLFFLDPSTDPSEISLVQHDDQEPVLGPLIQVFTQDKWKSGQFNKISYTNKAVPIFPRIRDIFLKIGASPNSFPF